MHQAIFGALALVICPAASIESLAGECDRTIAVMHSSLDGGPGDVGPRSGATLRKPVKFCIDLENLMVMALRAGHLRPAFADVAAKAQELLTTLPTELDGYSMQNNKTAVRVIVAEKGTLYSEVMNCDEKQAKSNELCIIVPHSATAADIRVFLERETLIERGKFSSLGRLIPQMLRQFTDSPNDIRKYDAAVLSDEMIRSISDTPGVRLERTESGTNSSTGAQAHSAQ